MRKRRPERNESVVPSAGQANRPKSENPDESRGLHSLESPFRRFTRDEWAQLRADTQLTLTIDDLRKLQSTHDPISLDEVVAIYLPLSRLLALYVAATQGLVQGDATISRRDGRQSTLHHRHCRIGRRRKIDDCPRAAGAADPLAEYARRCSSSPPMASCVRTQN